jgi:hypothetical protein
VIFDVRIVIDRTGAVRASIDGRRVVLTPDTEIAAALERLGRAIDGVAWAAGRPQADVLADQKSPLFAGAT